jgi:hypothetical protein
MLAALRTKSIRPPAAAGFKTTHSSASALSFAVDFRSERTVKRGVSPIYYAFATAG